MDSSSQIALEKRRQQSWDEMKNGDDELGGICGGRYAHRHDPVKRKTRVN
jgi:hypothetical protein